MVESDVSELSDVEQIPRQTASRQCDHLACSKLVESERPHHGRDREVGPERMSQWKTRAGSSTGTRSRKLMSSLRASLLPVAIPVAKDEMGHGVARPRAHNGVSGPFVQISRAVASSSGRRCCASVRRLRRRSRGRDRPSSRGASRCSRLSAVPPRSSSSSGSASSMCASRSAKAGRRSRVDRKVAARHGRHARSSGVMGRRSRVSRRQVRGHDQVPAHYEAPAGAPFTEVDAVRRPSLAGEP